MEDDFKHQVKKLLASAYDLIDNFRNTHHKYEKLTISFPPSYQKDFLSLVDKVNLSLMEDKDNFYGYFLFQMNRELRYDISSPTAINFRGANYVIYFNPVLFLNLSLKQMESTIKHEILHILSLHLVRARELNGRYSTLAINMAMDIVVNFYLTNLPPYATTLERVNAKYGLELKHYASFEYYADHLQTAIDLLEQEKDAPEDDSNQNDGIETQYQAGKTHDIWDESVETDEKTLKDFTEKVIQVSEKGELPTHVQSLISALRNSRGELPWNLYLNRLMGTVESNKKKTITRRNRRQPDRLDLRGELNSHKAKIVIGIDISASISNEEFLQAMVEVLSIVKNYHHEVTLVECDDEIRRAYKVNSGKDIKERISSRGGTRFSPVFEYANQKKINLLVYFTDGKGENHLTQIPRGYQVLWVISGSGEALSLKKPYGIVKKLSQAKGKEEMDTGDAPSGGFSMNYHEK